MRNRLTAGLLALFFGPLGVHRFYLGQITKGIFYPLSSIFLWPFTFIWTFIDAILILMMTQEEFDAKFNQDVQDVQVLQRNRTRMEKAKKRQKRKSNIQVKGRHQVEKNDFNPVSNRSVTSKAKQSLQFRKIWKNGRSLYEKYRFEEAEKAYLEALAINPNNAFLLFDLACLYSLTEQTAKAYKYLESAIHGGFDNFQEIERNSALAFLRLHEDYIDFAKAIIDKPLKA